MKLILVRARYCRRSSVRAAPGLILLWSTASLFYCSNGLW